MSKKSKGMLVVFSAPSGCGKDTVYHELLKKRDDIVESVSATTRAPRTGETEGVNYFFVSENEFRRMIDGGELLEYATYNKCFYGTPLKGVRKVIDEGKICLLIIEVNGAQKIMELFPDCVSIFLVPPSLEILEQRLYNRNKDTDESIKERLAIAEYELSYQNKYTYKIINDNLDDCVNKIDTILDIELKKRNAE